MPEQASPRARNSQSGESRRERNKRDKLARIVAAARALFQTQGYDKTTTQQIARAAEIASGTLFLYAKSKEDLLLLVFNDEMRELIERVYAELPDDDDVVEAAMGLFKGFIDYHEQDVDIARALIRELTFVSNPERSDEVRATVTAIRAKLGSIVTRGIERGQLSTEVDVRMLSNIMFALYYQQLQAWLGGGTPREKMERRLMSMLHFVAGRA